MKTQSLLATILIGTTAALSACAVDDEATSDTSELTSRHVFVADAQTQDPAVLAAHRELLASFDGWQATEIPASEHSVGGTLFESDAVSYQPCSKYHVCLWQDSDWQGYELIYTEDTEIEDFSQIICNPSEGCKFNGIHGNNGTFNDQMSSWDNESTLQYCWYVNKDFGGTRHVMTNGLHVSLPANESDTMSSLSPCR